MTRKFLAVGLLILILVAIPGCAGNLGDLFIPSDPEPDPIPLNDIFAQGAVLEWTGDTAQITDAPQPAIVDFYYGQIGEDVLPRWYRNERWSQLGAQTGGDVLKIEPLSELVDGVIVYGDDYTVLTNWSRDLGQPTSALEVPLARDQSNVYLRVNLVYLSETSSPIVRVTRKTGVPLPTPVPQVVVLNFAGKDRLDFRSGYILPTTVSPFDGTQGDRDSALEMFKSVYAPFGVTVLTDADPTPAEPFSTIYIGMISPTLGASIDGTSEFLDCRNAIRDDVAVIDVQSDWLLYVRVFYPDLYGQAIGRIASHEMGHLLGLVHVADRDDIMRTDNKGTGVTIGAFLERHFKRSAVSEFYLDASNPYTWTIGYQDTPAYLSEILGPAATP